MKIKTRYLIAGIVIILIGIYFFGWTKGRRGYNDSLALSDSLKKEIIRYKVKIGADSLYVALINQELLTEKQLRKQEGLRVKDLEKLNLKHVNEISKLNLRIDTLLSNIAHNGEVIEILNSQIANIDTTHDNSNISGKKAILLPFKFWYPSLDKPDPYLSFEGNFDINGILDFRLKKSIDVDVWTGVDKKDNPICVLTTKDPYIEVLNVASYKTDVKKPTKFGIGVQVGYGLILNKEPQLSPYVGIGVSKNFIRF